MENESYNDIDSLEDTFMAELFMENESWNIAHKVLDKMPKPVYGVVESDLDALDDMCLPALFNEAERITNAHKVFDGMTGRDHVKVVHVFIINKSKFSLVLVGNEMVVPLWDPGIGLTALTCVKLASQTNDVREKLRDFSNRFCLPRSSDNMRRVWDTGWQLFMYPKVVDIELRNVDCWGEVLRALCYKLPMDLWKLEDGAKHVLISKIKMIALTFDMVLMTFCYKLRMVPELQEASFGLLAGIIIAFVLGDLLTMEGYSNLVVALPETTVTEGARLCGPSVVYIDFVCPGTVIPTYNLLNIGKGDLSLHLIVLSMKENVLLWDSILQLTLHDDSKELASIGLSAHKWSMSECKIQKASQGRSVVMARNVSTTGAKVSLEGYILLCEEPYFNISPTPGIVHHGFLSYQGHLLPMDSIGL
ncbi:hypothetical protein A4A49_13584 [Nicotiana attenuata]|uniref:Uncharacterized protein n=1 Tax=Nicotiana attenuata TaxID=49451 RepID=A0A1J6IHU5_NICAT|nr:hypothetical protein A4A49_13584 [Nicotiana attenuata]